MEVLSLLTGKNETLKKLLSITREYESDIQKKDYSRSGYFKKRREVLFKVVSLYDDKISEAKKSIISIQPTLKTQIQSLLETRNRLLRSIQEADQKIISAVAQEKEKIFDQLKDARRMKGVIGKFKSQWMKESGEEINSQC